MKKTFNLLNVKQITALYSEKTGKPISTQAALIYLKNAYIDFYQIQGVLFFDEKQSTEWIDEQAKKYALNAKKPPLECETQSNPSNPIQAA